MKSAADTVTPIAAHLKTVNEVSADASRLMFDKRLMALWRGLSSPERLSLAPAKGPGKSRLYQLNVECQAGEFSVAFQPADEGLAAMVAAEDLSDSLRALAVEAVFGETAERLGAAIPGVRIVSFKPMSPADAPRAGWCLVSRNDKEFARVALIQLAPPVYQALQGTARYGRTAHAAWRTSMRLGGSVTVARRPLAIAVLRTLKKGDVVVLPHEGTGLEGARATLRLGPSGGRRPTAVGSIQGNSLVIEGGIEMLDDEQEPIDGGDADSLGELELPVRFEIETVSVPLAQLEAIAPGYVVELGMPATDAKLRLVSCGQVIGHAELVNVGGRLGARITRMVAQDDSIGE